MCKEAESQASVVNRALFLINYAAHREIHKDRNSSEEECAFNQIRKSITDDLGASGSTVARLGEDLSALFSGQSQIAWIIDSRSQLHLSHIREDKQKRLYKICLVARDPVQALHKK